MRTRIGGGEGRVPVGRSSFVGRESDLRRVVDALDGSAVVTLVGPAGVGKTRLVLEVAARIGSTYPDGARVALLGSVQEPSLVVVEVAACLGLRRTRGRPYVEAMLEWLEGRQMVVVLDNCEHVVEQVAELADVLVQRLPGLRILATSREPLGIAGEVLYRLAPLEVPRAGASAEAVTATEAVQLFVERARAREHRLELTGCDLDAVAEICRRLDGLPLAIELAAARVGVLAPAEIAERLDDRFRLLGSGLRTAEPRHRTLRSAVEWSHALLDEEERILFRRLAVFAGGFDLESAAAICAHPGFDAAAVVDRLARLVDKSLVVREPGPSSRYLLLETIRHFAGERLEAAGETTRSQDAHARWFAAVGDRAAEALRAGSERAWLDRLDRDHDNFRVALARLLETDEPAAELALASCLTMFWWTHGHHREGIGWLRAGLDRAPDAPAELRATALFNLAFLWAHDTDNWAKAAEFLDRGIAIARSDATTAASPILGYLLTLRGECANFAGDYETAEVLTREGAAIIRSHPDPWGAGFALWNIGFTHRCRGELDRAEACFEEMVAIQRRHGIGLVQMIGCKSLAEVAEARGELHRARGLAEESLQLRRELGAARLGYVHGSLPQALVTVARIALRQGDDDAASRALGEALPLAEEMRDADTVAEVRRLFDELHRRRRSGLPEATLRREGTVWSLAFEGERMHLHDLKGLRQLRELVARPRREIPAVALAAGTDGVPRDLGDAGPLLDERAREAYRRRLEELDDTIETAARFHDPERAARARAEREALVGELARATGLFGRQRRAGSMTERARVNVTRTLRDAIERIAEGCPSLAAHLDQSIRTGTMCSYTPAQPIAWRL